MRTMTGEKGNDGWVDGEEVIVYQRCAPCGHLWYFMRGFCPNCGARDPEKIKASGKGQVCAATLVHRAPSEELRHRAPYLIVMVDADEGFRLMAHGEPSLAIGDRVQVRFTEFGSRLVPYFERLPQTD